MQQASPAALGAAAAAAAALLLGLLMWRRQAAVQPSAAARREKLAVAEQKVAQRFSKVPLVSAREAQQLLARKPGKVVLVDVRNPEEQQVSMLPGPRVVTAQHFEQHRAEYAGATAVCMCTAGLRSAMFAQQLLDDGVAAANLQGGILAWTHEGLPLVEGGGSGRPTTRVHTYVRAWALQADGYEPIWYQQSYIRVVQDVLQQLWRRVARSAAPGGTHAD